MKRFDCTQLTNYIELTTIKNNKPPTLNELRMFINEMLKNSSYGNDVEPICHEQYLRYYINIYNLGDKISQKNVGLKQKYNLKKIKMYYLTNETFSKERTSSRDKKLHNNF